MIVTVIGARGFVGSAFARHLRGQPGVDLREVTRDTWTTWQSDVVVDCTGNPRKYIAERHPVMDFGLSVSSRMRLIFDYPAATRLFVSSIDHRDGSNYDVHKRVAEQLLAHYAPDWLVVRLSGMVGPGLKKNAVYDIMRGEPIRVHPASVYQYMLTDDAARISWELFRRGLRKDTVNVVGDGLITLPEVAAIAGKPLDLSMVRPEWRPWTQETDVSRLKGMMDVPRTRETVEAFLR